MTNLTDNYQLKTKNGGKDNPYQFLTDRKIIRQYLDAVKLDGATYIIRDDGIIDVDGSINHTLVERLWTRFPVKFGTVTGNFDCRSTMLKTLHGAPDVVKGSFNCTDNELSSLLWCPREVGGSFLCSNNWLTSLQHGPSEVGDMYTCSYNKLTNLIGAPNQVRDFNCHMNPLTSLKGMPKKILDTLICYIERGTEKEANLDYRLIRNYFDHSPSTVICSLSTTVLNWLTNNGIHTFQIVGEPDVGKLFCTTDILTAQEQMIDLGYSEFAKI